ncbi:MAG: hypothetical protein AB7E66_16725 [Parvibaculaceae bacterium]
MMAIYDALFINQLLGKGEGGETIYYPNGTKARGYVVPPEREGEVRRRLRLLSFLAVFNAVGLVILVRIIEKLLGAEIPLPWFIAGAVVVVVALGALFIRAMASVASGLEPVAPRS